jgi:hypothetical protein
MAQNKMTSDGNIVSILDYVDGNFSEVESSDSDNEIGDSQEFDCKSSTSVGEQSDRQVVPVVSGWHDVKWQMKIWLLDVLQ